MGFSILFAFLFLFLFGSTLLLVIIWVISKEEIYGKILGTIWLTVLSLIIFFWLLNFLNSKTELSENDIYGDYVIDKKMFKGKQADWQYEHFKFTITKSNIMDFHIMENGKIVKTISGKIGFKQFYASPRLVMKFEEPKFHILKQNPTLYRSNWSYYYVFESSKYGNMFFKKSNLFGN
jgi:hypothetical protein